MTPWPSQIEMATEAYAVLKKHGLVYISAEERTGKLLASVVTAEMCKGVERVLVLTTKKALEGWQESLAKYSTHLMIRATNYHQAGKVQGSYDLVILDECHNYLSAAPKRNTIWKAVRKLTINKPIIYTSATPHPQGRWQLVNQLALSTWSPWADYPSYYRWFNDYGLGEKTYVNSQEFLNYFAVDEERIEKEVAHLFVAKTRADLGFEHEPEDVLHYITLAPDTRLAYNHLVTHKMLELKHGKIIGDSAMKLLTALHMLEGGVAKVHKIKNDKKVPVYLSLSNNEKIQYIKDTWGDSKNVAIMYQYIGEGQKLRAAFTNATILQATTNAEGVDLSGFEHLIIYSQDFKTGKFSQRRARQANKKRDTPIKVHFLLVKEGISEQVYVTVSQNKKDFVDSRFIRKTL